MSQRKPQQRSIGEAQLDAELLGQDPHKAFLSGDLFRGLKEALAGWHPSKRQPLPGNEVLRRACVQLHTMARVTQVARAAESRHAMGCLIVDQSGNLTLTRCKRGSCVRRVQSPDCA